MSTDIQVISVVDDLQVTGVTEVPGAVPRTLRVVGDGGFTTAQRVLVNDYAVNTFVLVSDRVLLVALDSAFDGVEVANMDVLVISSALTSTRRVRLFFGPTSRPRSVSGVQKLIQQVVKTLLSNVGSNRFRVAEGGNLLKLTAFPLTRASQPRIVTALSQALSATEAQIIAAQAGERGLPAEERLLGLTLGGVIFDDATQEVQAKLRLTTYLGRSVAIPLIL